MDDLIKRLQEVQRPTGNMAVARDGNDGAWVHKVVMATDPPCAEAAAALAEAQAEIARLREAFSDLRQWCDAYPVAVFPEPDLKRVAEVLQSAGLTLDAVTASNFRYVLLGVREITDAALSPREGE